MNSEILQGDDKYNVLLHILTQIVSEEQSLLQFPTSGGHISLLRLITKYAAIFTIYAMDYNY